ncbi:Zinc finger protein-like 1 [Kappamyces sp. JEL0829]|nr:Zinc finger protein-like 1 [Kappamyces sp. JEL0829]
MGLCKCRNVTNLFCFEHRKNVCEVCIASTHTNCIVKSYLQWLQDSDFASTCSLCTQPLANGSQVVRLTCLDLFHFSCLDERCKALPATTTPSGYLCPTCNAKILPGVHASGPIASQLRADLKLCSWAVQSVSVPLVAPAAQAAFANDTERDNTIEEAVPLMNGHSSGIAPSATFVVPDGEEGVSATTRVLVDPDDIAYKTSRSSRSESTEPGPPSLKRALIYLIMVLVLIIIWEYLNGTGVDQLAGMTNGPGSASMDKVKIDIADGV